jgi:trans-aconitate 2-methyltransferase
MPDWDPKLYLKFAGQRGRPAEDLVAQIKLENPRNAVDLGCGTGTSTEQLHQRWPKAQLTGLDSSAEMLAQARTNHPDWSWVLSTVEGWQPAHTFDLIFSNACLHWVGDHGRLFPRLLDYLSPGGALAVQMPNNFEGPPHVAMAETAVEPRWTARLGPATESYGIQPVAFYYEALRKHASSLNIWETEYLQIMDGPRAILDWIRSTAMRFYLQRLPNDEERKAFEARCLERLEAVYHPDDQGKVLFPFRRMFIIAYR